jgi:hypothetical protein
MWNRWFWHHDWSAFCEFFFSRCFTEPDSDQRTSSRWDSRPKVVRRYLERGEHDLILDCQAIAGAGVFPMLADRRKVLTLLSDRKRLESPGAFASIRRRTTAKRPDFAVARELSCGFAFSRLGGGCSENRQTRESQGGARLRSRRNHTKRPRFCASRVNIRNATG